MRQLVSGAYTSPWWCLHKWYEPVITTANHMLGFIVNVETKQKQTNKQKSFISD